MTVVILLLSVIVGCSESTPNTQGPVTENSGQTLSIPSQILSARAVIIDQLEVEVLVNGELIPAARQGGNIWAVSIPFLQGDNVSVSVTWYENFEGERLPLATWSDTLISVQASQNIAVNSADYRFRIFDNDGDGISNLEEREAETPPLPEAPPPDRDSDGVLDSVDNCPDMANTDQANDDQDSEGNVCDSTPRGPDPDGDGIGELDDNCRADANPDQADVDGDGIGNVCDPINDIDTDGDTILNDSDNCPAIANTDQANDDMDTEGNVCDSTPRGPDPDDDGVGELDDNCPVDFNPDQADNDNDGIGNICDPTPEPPPCGGETGTDAISEDFDWSNNCTLRLDGEFADSYYTQGVERILFCLGFNQTEGDTLESFSDGFFGINTENAVIAFQQANELLADGIVGPQTWGALQAQLVVNFETSSSVRFVYGVTSFDFGCFELDLFYEDIIDDPTGNIITLGWRMAEPPGSENTVEFSTTMVP